MNSISVSDALDFVGTVQLPIIGEEPSFDTVAGFDYRTNRDQAAVVGSEIVSFVRGVTEERREDIVNSTLLAQLVANGSVPDQADLFSWYDTYFDVLTKIGWVIQTRQFADHTEKSLGLHAHEAILAVATTLLGPGTAAFSVVETTLKSLASMDSDSPWIKLFDRESQYANTARFQITLAEQGENDQFLVTLMAFALTAKSDLTQVLFFKIKSNEVKLRHSSGKLSVNPDVLSAVRQPIKQKLGRYATDFVRGLPDFG